MDSLTLFGFTSVTLMLVAYALERRGRVWILIFAFACLSSALYGLLADALPFAVVETVWAGVAFKRWRDAGQSGQVT
jgi:hypothetical protein